MEKSKQISTLSYAVRGRVLAKYLGQLGVVLALLLAAPLGVSLLASEYRYSLVYGGVSALLAALSVPLARWEVPEEIQVNEALAITVIAFIFGALVNVPAFLLAGLSAVDGLFESVSGVTTTGLSILPHVEPLPRTLVFARAWSQWYGGLGIIILSLALLAGHGAAFRRLLDPLASGGSLAATTRTYARRVAAVYGLLTLLGVAALLLVSVPPWHAVNHVLSAVSTGGFSSLDASLGALSALPAGILSLLSLSGAFALPVYFVASRRGLRFIFRDPEVLALLLLLALLSTALAALLSRHTGLPAADAVLHGTLLAFSAQTTTGFASLSVAGLPAEILVVLAAAMLIGGSLGSTAGGIKLMRVLVVLRLISAQIQRSALPSRAVTVQRWAGRRLDEPELERILLLVLLFLLLVLLSWLPLLFYGYDPIDSLFEVVSATATVGLSTGITAELPDTLKLLLCFDMLAGRVEIIALLVMLYPETWLGKRSRTE